MTSWIARSVFVVAGALLAMGAAEGRERPVIRSIGVISDVGNKITWKHIGFTVFTNEEAQLEFPGWQVDADVTGMLEAALKSRYELHRVTFAPGSIAPNNDDYFWTLPSPDENLRTHAPPADGPIDAYLVVWPRKSDLYPVNQYVSGLGIITMGGTARLFAMIAVTLVDARTFKEIDFCWPETRDSDTWRTRERKDLNAESFEAMTPEQKQAFEQGLRDFVHEGLANCLNDLKLLP